MYKMTIAEMKPTPKPQMIRPVAITAIPVEAGLKNTADSEDETSGDDGCSATDEISDITSHDGAEESAGRENRRRQRLFPSWELEGGLIGGILSAGGIGVKDAWVFHPSVLLDEVFHTQDSSHPSLQALS